MILPPIQTVAWTAGFGRLVPVLAQRRLEPGEVLQVIGWIALIAVVVGVAMYVVRRLFYPSREDPSPIGFTLSDLRRMHADGELSDEEYQRARDQMIAQSRAVLGSPSAEAPASPEASPPVEPASPGDDETDNPDSDSGDAVDNDEDPDKNAEG